MTERQENVVIETRGLSKDYKGFWGRTKVRAVNKLDLRIYRGEIFGLLGPNGSGKTTTLKLLLGLLHPTEGEIRILGGSPYDARVRRRIGFLPEETYLHKFLNARETLDFYGQIFGIPKKERKERIHALLNEVGIGREAQGRALREYSKGMMRRIGLAQALINDPELLMLDEPTSGLDPIGAREVKDLMLELKKKGKTILLSSHLLADVEDVCDRIAILFGGNLKKIGDVDDLLKMKEVFEVRVRTEGTPEGDLRFLRERFTSACASMGAEIENVRSASLTLEELFLRTIGESDDGKSRSEAEQKVREVASEGSQASP